MFPTSRSHLLLGLILVAGCSTAPATPTPAPNNAAEAIEPLAATDAFGASARLITPDEILRDVGFLASDELLGRDTPSPGLERAAEYLANQFAAAGLEPAGDDGTYLQRFPYTSVVMIREQREVSFTSEVGRTVATYGEDYYVLPGQQVASSVEVVWAGTAASPHADLAANSAGKIALFAADGNPLAGTGEAFLSAFQAAMMGGAAGIALALDDTQTADSIFEWAGGLGGSGLTAPIPVLGLTREVVRSLVSAGGQDLESLMSATGSVVLGGVTMTVSTPVAVTQATPPNVVAIRRGSDPELAAEYVVYSAHFDHVGVGIPDENGDSIYNGADDDASGTAVMMATARAFGRLEKAPRRSVVFLAVSGEEKGLKGSEYFAQNPTIPLEGIIMNINLDMVGRNHPDTVVAIGREYTNLGTLSDQVAAANPEIGLTIIQDPVPEEQLFFRSDHLHFVKQDIPAIFFSTGDHDQYHKASDHVELIDEEKAARIAKFVFLLGGEITSGNADPAWLPGGLEEVRRIIAENEGN